MKSDEMIKMLPDAYRKDKNSNNYKLFKMLDSNIEEISFTQEKIREYHCLDLAQGKALDLFGENLGLERKGLSDDVYRVLLKAKVLRNQGTGSLNNTTELIAYALNTDISNIKLSEDFETGGKRGYVTINNIPLTTLNNIGMSITEYEEMMKSIIPIGIGLSVTNLEGTFSFAIGDGTVLEEDENTGFADDNQTKGGTLGATVGSTVSYSIIKMPIYGEVEFKELLPGVSGVQGLSTQGEYILIEDDSETKAFIFEITANSTVYKFIAAKGSWNFWNYSQELTITEIENSGTLTLENPSQYIAINSTLRKISIENGATTYNSGSGVVPLTEFKFYEEADGNITYYVATLSNGVWSYEFELY